MTKMGEKVYGGTRNMDPLTGYLLGTVEDSCGGRYSGTKF